MNIDLQKSLDDLKAQWMVGGAAWDKSPRAWREAIQEDPFPELAILALAGQAIQFALQPNSDGNLQLLPLLPRLRLAPPPPSARQQFCLLVRLAKLTESQMSGVIHLFAARGFAVHPLDFMPRHFQQLPECYSPWQAWQQSDAAIDSKGENDEINSGNWDAWLPADRRTALAQLRQQHPSSCRDLIAEKASLLPADERLRVVELLADGLNADDRIVLESFEKDRSAKVRQFVQLCLARIGISQEDESDRNEFAAFYSVTKKMLSRGLKITANPLKTDAQKKRRAELASKLSLQGFMRGLSLASEEELIGGWHHVEAAASNELVQMVAATGSDRAVTALARRLASLEGLLKSPFNYCFSEWETKAVANFCRVYFKMTMRVFRRRSHVVRTCWERFRGGRSNRYRH